VFKNKRLAGVMVGLASILALAACSSPGGTPSAPAATAGTEANTGEAPAVAYVDSRYHYRVDAPGKMTSNADGTAAFVGPSERLQVAVVQGAKAADLSALARDDVSALAAAAAGFHLVAGPAQVTINGHRAEKFIYGWNAGTSAVTGKPLALVSARYYLPKDASTVAVVTYGIVSNQYDPQGADDVAATFQWQ
jgi:hypothetical protein